MALQLARMCWCHKCCSSLYILSQSIYTGRDWCGSYYTLRYITSLQHYTGMRCWYYYIIIVINKMSNAMYGEDISSQGLRVRAFNELHYINVLKWCYVLNVDEGNIMLHYTGYRSIYSGVQTIIEGDMCCRPASSSTSSRQTWRRSWMRSSARGSPTPRSPWASCGASRWRWGG